MSFYAGQMGFGGANYVTPNSSPYVGPTMQPFGAGGTMIVPSSMAQPFGTAPPPTTAGMGQALLQAALSQTEYENRELVAIEVHHRRLNRIEDVVDGLAREMSIAATDHELRMRKIEEFLEQQIRRMKTDMDQRDK
ncbi:unnamed protein product [Amoebophrya sp. A25]|nr:unnamed protein product [Amoebophrya sp. A25]|eukprot:GSA25T00016683001.1